MRQRGFLEIWMVLAIALGISGIANLALWNRLDAAHAETARIKGQFAAFKIGVEEIGKKAVKDKEEALKLQKESHDKALTKINTNLYALGVKYVRLRDAPGNSPSSSVMPAVPDTARPVDDKARDNRLLDILQHSEIQAVRLTALQDWVTANKNACGPAVN